MREYAVFRQDEFVGYLIGISGSDFVVTDPKDGSCFFVAICKATLKPKGEGK